MLSSHTTISKLSCGLVMKCFPTQIDVYKRQTNRRITIQDAVAAKTEEKAKKEPKKRERKVSTPPKEKKDVYKRQILYKVEVCEFSIKRSFV